MTGCAAELCARSGTRTRTPFRAMDFESTAFTDYAIRANARGWRDVPAPRATCRYPTQIDGPRYAEV